MVNLVITEEPPKEEPPKKAVPAQPWNRDDYKGSPIVQGTPEKP